MFRRIELVSSNMKNMQNSISLTGYPSFRSNGNLDPQVAAGAAMFCPRKPVQKLKHGFCTSLLCCWSLHPSEKKRCSSSFFLQGFYSFGQICRVKLQACLGGNLIVASQEICRCSVTKARPKSTWAVDSLINDTSIVNFSKSSIHYPLII